jgi:hypothetical protein
MAVCADLGGVLLGAENFGGESLFGVQGALPLIRWRTEAQTAPANFLWLRRPFALVSQLCRLCRFRHTRGTPRRISNADTGMTRKNPESKRAKDAVAQMIGKLRMQIAGRPGLNADILTFALDGYLSSQLDWQAIRERAQDVAHYVQQKNPAVVAEMKFRSA